MDALFWDESEGGYFEGAITDTNVLLRLKSGKYSYVIFD